MTIDHLRLTELTRTESPTGASADAVRRLLAVVAEWPEGTGVDLTFGTHDGRLQIAIAPHGPQVHAWHEDVRWALSGIAPLDEATAADPSVQERVPVEIVRVRPSRDDRPRRSLPDGDPGTDAPPTASGDRTPGWPQPLHDDLREMSRLLTADPELVLRWRLGSPTAVEGDMVEDALRSGWSGSPAEAGAYLGRPVRLVALLGSCSGPVPRRALVLARRWATSLATVPVTDVREVWSGTTSLLGAVVPEHTALGLLRLPAAGDGPFPGVATQHRPVPARALDPVPAQPDEPIRLGTATTVAGEGVDADLDVLDLTRHVEVTGQSGAGKSTFLAALVRGLVERGVGCTFLDPHGSTIDLVESELPERCDAVRVVRFPDHEHPVPINLLRGGPAEFERAVDLFGELVQRMYDPNNEGIVGPRWRRWFGLIATATHVALGERASLVTISEVARDVKRVEALAADVRATHPDLSASLMDEVVKDRSADAASVLAWCMSKLHPLVATGHVRAILGSGHDALDLAEAFDTSSTLLVDLGSPTLGEPVSRLLCALILEKARIAMGARRRRDLVHVIVVDEAHLVQFGALENLLSEARKFGIGIVVASQYRGQYRRTLAQSLEANAGSVVAFRSGISHAPEAALRLGGVARR